MRKCWDCESKKFSENSFSIFIKMDYPYCGKSNETSFLKSVSQTFKVNLHGSGFVCLYEHEVCTGMSKQPRYHVSLYFHLVLCR
jgi:hypothetical protein